jgi:endonuclease YncB( thermonuclease family)
LAIVIALPAAAAAQDAVPGAPQVLSPQLPAAPAPTPPVPAPQGPPTLALPPAPTTPDAAVAIKPPAETLRGDAIAIDGFTLDMGEIQGMRRRLRLISIDAPELASPAGINARRVLDDLLAKGPVECTLTGDRLYQREIARCNGADGKDLGEALLRTGVVTTARHSMVGQPWAQAYITAEHAGLDARRAAATPAAAPATAAAAPSAPRDVPLSVVLTAPQAAPLSFWDRNTKSEVLAAWAQAIGTIAAVFGIGLLAARRRA